MDQRHHQVRTRIACTPICLVDMSLTLTLPTDTDDSSDSQHEDETKEQELKRSIEGNRYPQTLGLHTPTIVLMLVIFPQRLKHVWTIASLS